jgi:hypothetical protein
MLATAAIPEATLMAFSAFSAPAPREAYAPFPSACADFIAAVLSRVAAMNCALFKRRRPTTGGRKSPGMRGRSCCSQAAAGVLGTVRGGY